MSTHPLLLGSFEFETEGSPLSLTFWQGDDVYQFLTNFTGVYPSSIQSLAKARKQSNSNNPIIEIQRDLEERLKREGLAEATSADVKQREYYAVITDHRVVQFFMDKRTFSKLSKEVRTEFATAYKQSIMWDVGYFTKAEFEQPLLDLLKEKNSLDTLFKQINSDMIGIDKFQREKKLLDIKKIINKNYDNNDFEELMISQAFEELGYCMNQRTLNKIQHIFKETRYSLENVFHFKNAQQKVFMPLKKKIPDSTKTDEYCAEIIKKDFSTRFFENCRLILGEKWSSKGITKAYDYIRKEDQSYPLDRLKELLRGKTKHIREGDYAVSIKGQVEELFSFIHDIKSDTRFRKDMKKLIDNKQPVETNYHKSTLEKISCLKEKKESLEKKIKEIKPTHTLNYDYDKKRTLLFLDVMSRDKDKKIKINGVCFRGMLSYEEYLEYFNHCFLDIEKFQYGSIKENISACATMVRNLPKQYKGQLDFIRPIFEKEIPGFFKVKINKYAKDLVKSIAHFVNKSKVLSVMTYGSYDLSHLKDTQVFKLGQSKKILPRQVVHEEFIKRHSIIGVHINLLTMFRIMYPQLLNHRLGTVLNMLGKQTNPNYEFEKGYSHQDLRETYERAEEIYHKAQKEKNQEKKQGFMEYALRQFTSLAQYTVNDVSDPMKILFHEKHKSLWEDLFDVCKTFSITLDQAANNANTTSHLIEKKYYEATGGFLSPGFKRKLFLDSSKEFRAKYTDFKTNKLLEKRLNLEFERGLKEGINKLYFSPELFIAEAFYEKFPELESFVNKTLSIEDDPERQIRRLQYLRGFVLNPLTELYIIDKMNKEAEQLEKQALEFKAKDEKKAGKKQLEFQKKRQSTINKKYFFKSLFGVRYDEVKERVEDSYKEAARIMNLHSINAIQVEGNFIYAHENLSLKQLSQAGLFRVKKDLTVYNMKENKITYEEQGSFANYPSRWDHPNFSNTQFELNVMRLVLEYIFAGDTLNALDLVNSSASALHNLEAKVANPKKKSHAEFIQNLLTYHRGNNKFQGVTDVKEEEKKRTPIKRAFIPDDINKFRPSTDYYKNDFMKKFFGLTRTNIDVNAKIPLLLRGVLFMGDDNSVQTKNNFRQERENYRQLIKGTFYSQEQIRELMGTQKQLFPELSK